MSATPSRKRRSAIGYLSGYTPWYRHTNVWVSTIFLLIASVKILPGPAARPGGLGLPTGVAPAPSFGCRDKQAQPFGSALSLRRGVHSMRYGANNFPGLSAANVVPGADAIALRQRLGQGQSQRSREGSLCGHAIISVCRKTPFLEFEPASAVKFAPDLTGGFRVKWT